MKRLFAMLALSLVMVACNKEEGEQLTGWDKIIAEVEPVEMPVLDVLHSLNENEAWECRSAYAYILNETTGEVEEHILVEDFFSYLYGGDMPTLRYVDNVEYRFQRYSCGEGDTLHAPITSDVSMEDDDTIVKLVAGDYISRYNIIAYDENQIIFDEYFEKNEGIKCLYKKMWYERKVDDTKWWEKAENIK